ncbi:hypothetical protein ED733_006039 [Metarhizium rileyi]|uniref:Zn(2)-C6 fungal-type domain-containing protein n=1 Tax=Metarhizium rileyi (strain RCEF 4871) TaxID=1649241 RepID=A0A5C6GAA2_METRR|nr:hypothetical protein ED733_006039 [Metarhizium rileyi]
MDAMHIFRQGLGSVPSRPKQPYTAQYHTPQRSNDDLSDDDGSGHRVAHTLTACCRCRQRKTRCDPNLPRCLPCERSGSICEYLDTAKGKKINRYYVIKLQDKVRALEAELAHYTDDENDYPRTTEDIVRPGGMIRLKASDETSRYLGPSSGIAMTRLLMEEAKRYTASNRISDLIPEVRARNQARMQSIQMSGPASGRKKSYPMVSDRPADGLPSRATMDKLLELYIQKSQVFWPVLHEKDFERDMEAVYNGDEDPYKNIVLRMVIAISLQKFDAQYAGLADSYYLAAMQYAEAVIRPKDLKTLQCLALIGHYSLLTPTRTPVYYVIGLATRICQQEGLTDEQTITAGYHLDEQTIDMRRRLAWIVAMMDFGLSYHMGRPSGFAAGNDKVDVSLFSTVGDEHITENGISSGPTNPQKAFVTHFYQIRELQSEIRRTLYEQKRPEPNNDSHPWYTSIEEKLKTWLDAAPDDNLQWCFSWCATFYHHTRVVLYRPSPQVPQPSARAATICFKSSAFVINLAEKQMINGLFSITWLLLLMLTSCLNVLLWSTSYLEVRQAHSRQEVEDIVARALACLEKCTARWPGTRYTAQLYGIISNACLQSYDRGSDSQHPMFTFASPSSVAEPQSSPDRYAQTTAPQQQLPYLNPPQFGFVFDSPSESMNAYTFDPNYPPPQPTFRSNSIFCNPATDANGRRFSYFPPEGAPEDHTAQAAAGSHDHAASPSLDHSKQIPTPPDSIPTETMATTTPSTTLSPQNLPLQSSTLSDASSAPRVVPIHDHISPPQSGQPTQVTPNFTTARPSVPQRPLPVATTAADWFSPPAPFISPYNFGPMCSNFLNDTMPNNFAEVPTGSLGGLQTMSTGFDAHGQYGFISGRHDSLTHSQQLELMNTLETEGVGDIDAFLNAGNNMTDVKWCYAYNEQK